MSEFESRQAFDDSSHSVAEPNAGRQDSDALHELLQNELETLQTLDGALEEEHAALTGNDAGKLEAVTKRKSEAVAEHRARQHERLQWMQRLGLPSDLILVDLVARLNGSNALYLLQSELAELADRCQENNRRNGGLITRLRERTQNALSALRGESANSDVYSPLGAKQHRNDARSLGKA